MCQRLKFLDRRRGIGIVIRVGSTRRHRHEKGEAGIDHTDAVEPNRGINKREATASSYYPEEWPKDLFAMVPG